MNYKVTMRLGRNTETKIYESDSIDKVINAIETLTEYKVLSYSKIIDVNFSLTVEDSSTISIVKLLCKSDKGVKQMIFHNVKSLSKLKSNVKKYITIKGKSIKSIFTTIYKK